MKKIAHALLAAAMAGGLTLGTAGVASAAHCTGTTEQDMSSPGFSYFGRDHVQSGAHDNEGQGVHAGTSGASNCRETTGSPSDRAPGSNR